MEEMQEALISAVKFAVTKYGLAAVGTRNVANWRKPRMSISVVSSVKRKIYCSELTNTRTGRYSKRCSERLIKPMSLPSR